MIFSLLFAAYLFFGTTGCIANIKATFFIDNNALVVL